ncbi:MAG: PRC-barrel domain-containing protein [Sphingomonas sp.]|uniref:PRC-barrel domain-containing protein n=1 Tax=Sphingomonas sp. TaxID=28214 RepID=UPI003F7E23D5
MTIADQQDALDHPLILSSRVLDTPVYNLKRQRIGHLDDLSVDKATGQVVFAIMSFGGFLGIGERFHPIPWPLLHYDPGLGGFIVQLESSVLQRAPHYDRKELRALGGADQHHGAIVHTYYRPYGGRPVA